MTGSLGQDLVAGVAISDSQNKVNQQATYRFTLIPEELSFDAGTVIKTYIPSTVSLILGSSGGISICRRYISLSSTTQDLTCSYDSSEAMIKFTITSSTTFDVAYQYDIAYIQNPSVSSLVSGFRIVVENSSGQTLYDTTVDTAAVYIQPGDITGQSLSISSLKVSDTSTYTFQFQISNTVPQNGLIQVTFPYNEIDVPTLSSSDTRIKIYDNDWKTGTISSTTRIITFLNAFTDSSQVPDSSKYIYLEIQKIVNPKSLKETSSFQIATMDSSTYYKIDQATTGMTVQPTIPGDITVTSVAPQTTSQVGQSTDINFNIQINQVYESGGYLLITFPTEVVIKTLTCYPFIGFVTQDSNCIITVTSPQTVKISNQVSSTRLYFLISSCTNPSSTKPTSTFKIQAYDSSNYLMGQVLSGVTYTATPASLKTVTSVRSLTEINVAVTLTIAFTTTNALVSGDYIYIKVPYDQQVVDTSTSFICQVKTSATSYSTTTCTVDTTTFSSYFVFWLLAPCSSGCSASTVFTVQVTNGIKNPSWKVSSVTKSIEVQTMTSDLLYIRDRKITAVYTTSDLTEGTLSSITLTKQSKVVNQQTSFQLVFTNLNTIPVNGLIRLYFLSTSFYSPTSGSISCSDTVTGESLTCTASSFSTSGNGIEYIQISSKCTTQCAAGSTINVTISNLLNRASIKNLTNYFVVKTYTSEGYNIDSGIITNANNLDLETASFTTLQLTSPSTPIITGALSTYSFKIQSLNGIYASTGLLEIYLPSEISITSSSPKCTATVSTYTLTCTLNSTTNLIQLKNSNTGQNFANSQITITLTSSIYNPKTTKPSSYFKVQTSLYDSTNQTYYLVDYDYSTLTITADTANTLSNVTVTRSNTIINEQSDFTITFITYNPIPKNSKIIIYFPKDQVIFKSDETRTYTDQSQNSQVTELDINGIDDSSLSYVSVTLQEWCSGSSETECSSKSELSLKVSGGLYNPSSTKVATISFQIKIQTDEGYNTDQKVQDIFATLLSAGPFQEIQISEQSQIVGDLNTVTVSVRISSAIPSESSGKLSIKLPSSMYYIPVNGTSLSCSDEVDSQTCNTTTQSDTIGTYYDFIYINMNCKIQSCSSGTMRTFNIGNLRNRFSTKPFTGIFIIQSLDDDGYSYDAQSVNTYNNVAYKLSQNATVSTITRSNNTVSSNTKLSVSMIPNVRMAKNSIVQLYIPKELFSSYSSLDCYNSDNQNDVDCSINKTITDDIYYGLQFKEFCSGTPNYCTEEETFTILIKGFINRYNTQEVHTTFKFQTYTSEYYAIEESVNVNYPENNLVSTLAYIYNNFSLSNINVGGNTNFQFTVNFQNEIQINEFIKITFNTPIFYNTETLICYMQSSSYPTQHISSCTTNYNSDNMITDIQFIMPISSDNSETLTLQVNNMQNILENKPLSTVINIKAYTSSVVDISYGTLTISNYDYLEPVSFTSVDITRDNNDLDTEVTITLTFESSITVLQNSIMTILIPKSQLVNSEQQVTCTFESLSVSCTYQDQDDDYAIISFSSICINSQCSLNQAYTFTISGFKNPQQVSALTLSFYIEINSAEGYKILNSTDFDIEVQPPLQLGSFNDLTMVQSGSLITGYKTSYDFSFKFPQDVTNDIKIYLKVPQDTFSIDSQIKCFDNITLKYYSCQVNDTYNEYVTLIVIENYCQISNCDTSQQQKFQVQGIKNVDFARPRNDGYFQVMATNSENFVLVSTIIAEDTLPSFQIRQLDTFTVTRENSNIGETGIDLLLTFNTPNRIPHGSHYTYYIPIEQVSFIQTNNIICQNNDNGKKVECQVIDKNDTYIKLQVTEWCSKDCSVGSKQVLKIKSTINPNTLDANNPSNSFGLFIETQETYGIMEVYQDINALPKLSGSLMLDNILIAREMNLVGAQDYITAVIPLQETLSNSIQVVIDTPIKIAYQPQDGQTSCLVFKSNTWKSRSCKYSYNSTQEYGLKTIYQVQIDEVCTIAAPCQSNQNMIIKFKATNPLSQYEENSSKKKFKITLRANDNDIAQSIINNTLSYMQPNIITASFIKFKESNESFLECYKTGELCKLQINITTSNPFTSSNQWLQINIPNDMALITSSTCTAYLADVKVTCKIINLRQLQITHSQTISTLKKLQFEIELTNIRNPFSTKESQNFTIATYHSVNGLQYKIDENKQKLTYQVSDPSPFQKVVVTRNHQELYRQTMLIFDVKIENNIPSNGYITITIPESQGIINTDSLMSCFLGTKLSTSNTVQCEIISNTSLKVTGLCSSFKNGCDSYTTITFSLAESIIYNPPYIQDTYDIFTDSIIVTSLYQQDDQEYLIEQTSESIFILPNLLANQISIENFNFQNYYTSQLQNINFTAKYDEIKFSSNYLRIKLDSDTFNKDPYYDLQVKINNKQAILHSFDSNDDYSLNYLIVECNTECKNKDNLAIEIQGFKNPYYKYKNLQLIQKQAFNITVSEVYQIPDQLLSIGKRSCNDPLCYECTKDGNCLKCNIPSSNPLLQENKCVEKCENGFFEFDKQCYICSYGCQNCQTYDQCSSCDPKTESLIDGICVKNINKSQICPNGTTFQGGYGCVNNQQCTENCVLCGPNTNYCHKCSQNLTSLNGICVDSCPSGYYQNQLDQCIICDSLCSSCYKNAKQCTGCRRDFYTQNILDLTKNTCLSSCSDGSILRENDPYYCDSCSNKCYSCSLFSDNCTSCYYDKQTLEDLFYYDNQCLTKCPIGYNQNYQSHVCEETTFEILSLPPIYLLSSTTIMGTVAVASKLLSNRLDNTGEVVITIMTQIEFLNRVMLLGNLWESTKTFSFCITGMNILLNSFVAIYFATLVMTPICNQLQSIDSKSLGFRITVGLSQVTGINTLRLLTSKFFGLETFSNKFNDIAYYVKHLEAISLISSVLCLFQLATGLSCIFDFSYQSDALGFGVNSIILNIGLIGLQAYKYINAMKMVKTYESVSHRA